MGCGGSKGAEFKRQLDEVEEQASARSWRTTDGRVGDLTRLEDLVERLGELFLFYSGHRATAEYGRVLKISDEFVDDLVFMMDTRLLLSKDLVTVQNLIRLSREVERVGASAAAVARVEDKHKEVQLNLGKAALHRVGAQLSSITSAELLLDGSRKALSMLQDVHLYAMDVLALVPSFLQYCTAFSVKILEQLRSMIAANPRELPAMQGISRTIDTMCCELTKGGGDAKWDLLSPKVQEIGVEQAAELLPGKLDALEEELRKPSRMSRAVVMGTLGDIGPLWLSPPDELQARLRACLDITRTKISDSFDKAVEVGELNKLDALVAVAKEFDDHVSNARKTSGTEGEDTGQETLTRVLERKRAGVTLKTLLDNAEHSIATRTKELQEQHVEVEGNIKNLPRGKLDSPVEGARWSFKLGSGGFKQYSDDKNREVEKLFQAWVNQGKPARRQEISIMVEGGSVGRRPRAGSAGGAGEVRRPRCKYGEKCYRKNVEHRREFSHPTDPDWDDEAVGAAGPGAGSGIAPDGIAVEVPPTRTESTMSVGTASSVPPMVSAMRQEKYVLDFGMMTQFRHSGGGSARRLIKRDEGMTLAQSHTHKYFLEIVEFVKELESMFAQAEVEMRLLGEDNRQSIQLQVDTLLKGMKPSLKKFLELAVYCKDKESLKVISLVQALLGVHAESMGFSAALRDLNLNDILNALREAYMHVEPVKNVHKWALVRLLCKKQVVGPKRLLKCRLALVKKKLLMEKAKHQHLRMRCQALLSQYESDKDFGGQFRKGALEALEVAMKRAVEYRDTEAVMTVLHTAMSWKCDVDSLAGIAGSMVLSMVHSVGKFKWEPLSRCSKALDFGITISTTTKRSLLQLCDLRPELPLIMGKVTGEIMSVTRKGDEGMPASVKQVVDCRAKLRDEPVIKGFDEEFWRSFEQEYKSITETEQTTRLTEWVIAYCEQLKLPLPSWMMNKGQVEALNKLQEAVDCQDEQKIREAVVFAKQTDYTSDAKLYKLYEDTVGLLRTLKRLPAGWEVTDLVGDDATAKMFKKVDMDGTEVKALFQKVVDDTKADIITRDRIGAVPRGYKVEKIVSVMNAEAWGAYLERLDVVSDQCKKFPEAAPCPDTTWANWSGPIATHNAAKDILKSAQLPELSASGNEFLMFHGTKPEAAESIAQNNFDMAFACKTGLFGAGLYFAESSSKSDEYVKPDGESRYPVLLCRVTLGHINYIANKDPTTDPGRFKLESSCLGGEYHSVLGDRKKAKGTYREFVVYNHHQVYPHFIVWYKRL